MPAEAASRDPISETGPSSHGARLRQNRIGHLRRFVVSLDRPAAFHYLLDTLYPPHGRRERFRLALARLLPWRIAARWVLRIEDADDGAPLAKCLPLLHDLGRHPELLAKAAPGDAPVSWIASSRRSRGPTGAAELAFLLPGGSPAPTVALELHRAGESTASGAEADALRWLATSLSPPLAERVPRVLFHVVRDDLEALALTALSGPSAYVELHRRGGSETLAMRHLDAAGDWLIPFQRETRSGETWELPRWIDLAPPALAAGPAPRWWDSLCSRLERRSLPGVGRHGDFWARNLLPGLEDGPSRVVDWEAFRRNASPLDDLFDFPLSYGELLTGASPRGSVDAFLRTFGEAGFPGPEVWIYVRLTLAGLGIEPGIDRSLLSVYLLDRARHAGIGPLGRLARDRPASFWLECFRRWNP